LYPRKKNAISEEKKMDTHADERVELTDNATKVLNKRYLKKDAQGSPIETPTEMFLRVARNIAQADLLYNKQADVKKTEAEFHSAISGLDFLPNSPTLMNAGRDLQQLSACFVLPIEDSMEGIFETLKCAALIHKSGGGTGFSFSRLRPKKSQVKSTGGVASGPVSFMKVFDASTQAVKQGGCVAPDTRVATGKGLVKIKELGPITAPADSWHKYNPHPVTVATDNGPKTSDEFYNHGISATRTIKTKNGYKVTGTGQHRLRVIDERGEYVWRHIKNIKRGDWLALQKDTYMPNSNSSLPIFDEALHFNAKKINIPEKVTAQLGEFIGYMIGDGAISVNKRGTGRLILSISDREKDIAGYMLRITKELFGITPIPQKKKGDLSTNYFFNSTHLVKWLSRIGVDKPSAHEVFIPEIVFKAGPEFAKGFLRGLFSADGTATKEGYPSLSTVSEALIEDLRQLLLSLGMPSAVSVKRDRKAAFGKRVVYHIRIITEEGIKRFTEEIGFLSQAKNKRLRLARRKAWEFNDVIPNQEEVLRAIYNGPGRGCAKGKKSRGANRPLYRNLQHYLPNVIALRNLSRRRLKELAGLHPEVKNHSTLSWFLTNKQFYDRVTEINEGESLTLDLSVPENNTYIANGFVSHNTRRGANMGILRVDHPDILEFIQCKENDKEISNFNISVGLTEGFMSKVENEEEYDLIDPRTKKCVRKLKAKEVFDLIVKMAWKNGEPGIIFLDRMNKYNPTPALGEYEATNPCGEQVLLPFESCNLGSINLAKMVDVLTEDVDWDKLARTVKVAVHFLDNVIDMNRYPLKKIEEMTKGNRKIGLGVMGFADMLIGLSIPYNSSEAVKKAKEIMAFILGEAERGSCELAQERGVFPNSEKSVYNTQDGMRLRNATLTTIAPTGTLSIIAGCSSGIEPLFAVSYVRTVMDKDALPEINPYFEEIAKERGFYAVELMKLIAQKGSIQEIPEIPADVRKLFVTSHDISPEWHARMQGAFQESTNNAVSKTVNFANSATESDVRKVYMLASKLGCKGVTIYRDGSRDEQVLSVAKEKKEAKTADGVRKILPKPRPEVTKGTTTKVSTGCGNLYITINEDEKGLPFEIFMQMGKAGGCAMSQLEAIGRLLSLALRSGINISSVTQQLRGIRCPSPSWEKGGRIFSCSDAIARVIEKQLVKVKTEDGESPQPKPDFSASDGGGTSGKVKLGSVVGVCPDCGGALRHVEGCMVCHSCGYSKCG